VESRAVKIGELDVKPENAIPAMRGISTIYMFSILCDPCAG
jgi:hypothetical protein